MTRSLHAARLASLVFLALSATACAHAFDDPYGEGLDAIGEGGHAPIGCNTGGAGPATTGSGGSGGEVVSSSSSSSSTGGHVTASSSSGGDTCDNTGQCDICANCSINAACAGPMNGCMNDFDCTGLLDCLNLCQDQSCADACATQHPTGLQLYSNLMECVLCGACYSDCDGASSGC